ncbi:MAG: serine/threonine-protein kinase, partial [Pseudomonadota bacterium]
MSNNINCPHCDKHYQELPAHLAGKVVQCRECHKKFQLPAASKPATQAWRKGDIILDLYEVQGLLGQGSFGQVYQLHHQTWQIDLAVKAPRPDVLKTPGSLLNFEQEAKTWVAMRLHPHIVSCYYVRRIENIPYIFSEYVSGGTLSQWIQSEKLYAGGLQKALSRVLDVAIQLAWGLHAAHEQGLIHQDVKPANVMMTAGGIVKITDFGLTRAFPMQMGEVAEDGGTLTAQGVGMTPGYASPEQMMSQILTRRSDLWSWAVLVLEMFIGERTWQAGSVAMGVLQQYRPDTLNNPLLPPMPDEVNSLLMKCFHEKPENRPETMEAAANILIDIYQVVTGFKYSREQPDINQETADNLNNRAISLMDMGQAERAQDNWARALKLEPQHFVSTYNQGLMQWRHGEITDIELTTQLKNTAKHTLETSLPIECLLQVHAERGDNEAITQLLKTVDDTSSYTELLSQISNKIVHKLSLTGDTHRITALALSTDGKFVISGGHDKTIKLWDIAQGNCIRELQGHSWPPTALALTRDGRCCASVANDHVLRVWELSTGKLLRSFSGLARPMHCLQFDINGQLLFGGDDQGAIKVWHIAQGECSLELNAHTQRITSIAGGATHLLSAGAEGVFNVWHLEQGKLLRSLDGKIESSWITSFSDDGRYALSADLSETHGWRLRFWDVVKGECLHTRTSPYKIESIALSTRGRYGVIGHNEGYLTIWLMATGQCLRTLHVPGVRFTCLDIAPNGNVWVAGQNNGQLGVHVSNILRTIKKAPWHLSRVQAIDDLLAVQAAYQQSLLQARESLNSKAFSEASCHIREARRQPGQARAVEAVELWRSLYRHLPRRELNGLWQTSLQTVFTNQDVARVVLSDDGQFLVLAGEQGGAVLWNIESNTCLLTLEDEKKPVAHLSFSSDSEYLLYATTAKTSMLKVWSLLKGSCIRTLQVGENDEICDVSLGDSGRFALSAHGNGDIKLWHISRSTQVKTLGGHETKATAVAISADGRHCISGDLDGELRWWALETGLCEQSWQGHQGAVQQLKTGLDGYNVLSSGADGLAKYWRADSGICLQPLQIGQHGSFDIHLDASGEFALSCGADNVLKVWQLNDGLCIYTVPGSRDKIKTFSASLDGRFLITGHEKGGFGYWTADWKLESRKQLDWHNGAQPYLDAFVQRCLPIFGDEPITTGKTLLRLRQLLGGAGYGWLNEKTLIEEFRSTLQHERQNYVWGQRSDHLRQLAKRFLMPLIQFTLVGIFGHLLFQFSVLENA